MINFVVIVLLVMGLSLSWASSNAYGRNHHFYPPSPSTGSQSSGGWLGSPSSVPSSPGAAKKATVWEAPTTDEMQYKSELEASQIQNGLTHPQTMKAMWQLGQYYLNAQKYSEASQTLADLKDVALKNKSHCPLPMDKVNLAYDKAQTEMRKEQAAGIGNGSGNGQNYGQNYRQNYGPSYHSGHHRHNPHHRRYYQP